MIIVYAAVVLILVIAVSVMPQVKIYNRAGSIYYKDGVKQKLYEIYDRQLAGFPAAYTEHYIDTDYGKVHVIECGNKDGKPLVMFHAASVGSVSWKDNVQELGKTRRLYLVDTLGEGNKSELSDVEDYPKSSEDMSDLYISVLDGLGIKQTDIAGASYGGFICLNIALNYPERVGKIVLIGSMGVAPSVPKVLLKLTFYSFFPYKIFRAGMADWAFGKSGRLDDAREYFNTVLSGVLGRYYAPMTIAREDLKKIQSPVLLMLGSNDNLVGDPQKAIEYTSVIQSIETLVL